MDKRLFRVPGLFALTVLALLAVIILSSGCSKNTPVSEDIIAKVNNEPVRLNDFQRELALRSKQNPDYRITPETVNEQLETIIDRRLMIQEAMKSGLANSEDFVRTIQTFWEQTLIRELIEAKNHEWEDRLFVTEKEINGYYERVSKQVTDLPPLEKVHDQIKQDILKEKETAALDKWLNGVRKKAAIDINKELIESYLKEENQDMGSGAGGVK